mmetsp:Transcript_1304/g.4302  ORF Transcript_1304/g.4302 Transcript_1304/m.4302 type:complete len:241 (+) Transcript_1304:1390-2112(+)
MDKRSTVASVLSAASFVAPVDVLVLPMSVGTSATKWGTSASGISFAMARNMAMVCFWHSTCWSGPRSARKRDMALASIDGSDSTTRPAATAAVMRTSTELSCDSLMTLSMKGTSESLSLVEASGATSEAKVAVHRRLPSPAVGVTNGPKPSWCTSRSNSDPLQCSEYSPRAMAACFTTVSESSSIASVAEATMASATRSMVSSLSLLPDSRRIAANAARYASLGPSISADMQLDEISTTS